MKNYSFLLILKKDLRMAKYLMTQYGQMENSRCWRYLTQRYTMPDDKGKALLTDIGTELAQRNYFNDDLSINEGATPEEQRRDWEDIIQLRKRCISSDPEGVPFTVSYFSAVGDPIANLVENLAAEEKARATYENLMHLTDDTDVLAPLNFLRQREIIHYERFLEYLNEVENGVLLPSYEQR